jgi:hypothetical protein
MTALPTRARCGRPEWRFHRLFTSHPRAFALSARAGPEGGSSSRATAARAIGPVDALQDWVFHLAFTELLRRANEFLGAHALSQNIAALARRPCDVPDARGLVVRRRHHPLAIDAERRGAHRAAMAFQDGGLLAALRIPDARGAVPRRRHHPLVIAAARPAIDQVIAANERVAEVRLVRVRRVGARRRRRSPGPTSSCRHQKKGASPARGRVTPPAPTRTAATEERPPGLVSATERLAADQETRNSSRPAASR